MRHTSPSTRRLASDKQVAFLRSLLNDKQHDFSQEDVGPLEALSANVASMMIDRLLRCPRLAPVAQEAAQPAKQPIVVVPGFYAVGDEIFKVQPSRSNPERAYAKVLVVEVEETTRSVRWEYAAGAMGRIARDGRALTIDEAKAFGKTHGFCMVCARLLTDEASVEAGIGPVCAKKF